MPPGGELRGEEVGEVSLDEAKYQNMAYWSEGSYEDDAEGNKDEDIPGCASEGLHLSGLQSLPCSAHSRFTFFSQYIPVVKELVYLTI